MARKLWAIVNIFKEADSNWLGVFTSIQISWRNLNKVLPIDSIEQKVITPGDIASDSKVYIDEKEDYVMQMAQRRHVFSLACRVYLQVSAQHRQWPARLEFIQLHFLQPVILHAIISQTIKLQATINGGTAHEQRLKFSL